MNNWVFAPSSSIFRTFAKYYDTIYSDKDYEHEIDVLEGIFTRYCASRPLKILDAGCGTGNHSILLAKRHYQVTGIDGSESMIDVARKKASVGRLPVDFRVMSLRELHLEEKYHACICMFNVIGYLTGNDEVLKSLRNIRTQLYAGSIFVFDFWYAPAVLAIKPSVRTKEAEKDGIRIVRSVQPSLNTLDKTCVSNYRLKAYRGDTLLDDIQEAHAVRFFFQDELMGFLTDSNFEPIKFCEFLDLNTDPTDKNWNAICISKAV